MNRRGFLSGLLGAIFAGPSMARAALRRSTAINVVTITSAGDGYLTPPMVTIAPAVMRYVGYEGSFEQPK